MTVTSEFPYIWALPAVIGIVAVAMLSPTAYAEIRNYSADLTGSAQVPPVDTKATGTAEAHFDTDNKMLTWRVDYKDLTGVYSAAHFHGPARTGENAAPVVDISKNVKEGTATLTDQQAADLDSGVWYVNVHTDRYPDGEIRGQVLRVK